ncbi:MAG: VOC family protein [Prolixibacteraceae bacterium]|nr:VOC family protein [Prolixibacteraceae bacterium]
MIHHIALTVNESAEVKNFYENVLLFNVHHQFKLTSDLSNNIFGLPTETEVAVMRHHDMEFELFLSAQHETKAFSHVCLTYWKSERIYNKAKRAGYKTVVKPRNEHDTYFIWDRSGNLFEIKELVEDEEWF